MFTLLCLMRGYCVHFHVFAFQMCCNKVIKMLHGISHLFYVLQFVCLHLRGPGS